MRILVVGAGSTGGYFGGRLIEAGRDVTFLVRPARRAQLEENGLHIVTPTDEIVLRPRLVEAGMIDGPFDIVLVAVKGFALGAALEDVAPAIGPATMILPVLNGMRHMDVLEQRFGPTPLMGCACRIGATLDDGGRVIQMSPLHELTYGERSGVSSQRAKDLDGFMQDAGFDARLSDTIMLDMWEKWAFLASLGGMNCLMRADIGAIAATEGGKALSSRFFSEVVECFSRLGVSCRPDFIRTTRAMLCQDGSSLTSSMYRDLQGARPLEVDAILGDLSARAAASDMDVPLLDAATCQLRIYQRGLSKS